MSEIIYEDSPIITIDVLVNDEVKKFSIAAIESYRYSYAHGAETTIPKLVFLSEDKNHILVGNPYSGGETGIGVSKWTLKDSFDNTEPFKIITDDSFEAIRLYKEFIENEKRYRKEEDAKRNEIEKSLRDEFSKDVSVPGLTIEFSLSGYKFLGRVYFENTKSSRTDVIMLFVNDHTVGKGLTKSGRISKSIIDMVRSELNISSKEAKEILDKIVNIHMETYQAYVSKRSELYSQTSNRNILE